MAAQADNTINVVPASVATSSAHEICHLHANRNPAAVVITFAYVRSGFSAA